MRADASATLEDTWAAHRGALLRLGGLLTGSVSAAEDVVAEAVARFVVASRGQPIADPGAYLRRCVVNEVIGRGRRRRTEERYRFRVVQAGETPDGTDAVAETERLWVALGTLPPRQRAVLVLRFYEDRSEAETAELLGMPVGTVKSTASRGLAALRQALGEEER